MSQYNAPRRGSMAYYPRVRAKKETPTIKGKGTENKPLSFLAYKVGMVQVKGKNTHKNSPTFGMDTIVPATVIATPTLKVFGVRAYTKREIGIEVLSDVLATNVDKFLLRKINNFKKPSQKKQTKENKTENKNEKKEEKNDFYTLEDFEKEMNDITGFTLLVHTTPNEIGLKKTPDVTEITIGGTKEEQLNYAKEKLGKEIKFEEVFNEQDFLDVKAVTKGKGFSGVVKRFNVRSLRPKNKKRRVVGSVGPWHPHTIMFTVARPGQMGYHNRTESGKKLIKISTNPEEVNPSNGFSGYGIVKGQYALVYGSIPGPAKRCIALRKTIRPAKQKGVQLEAVEKIIKK
ncbi:MAG: 50S ribosomal protein L3 [Candidatus Diapherotrites archaeon]|jgi:large subunit ribosomal protein L3|uniref:50S ribosomal protein L3 n=1 Tax=Candidatus Iainarchaeum sp. TaxID=3101447 RepID=A0A7K4BYB4_9ARCH|nr:50S ribosomal protein L3 [Candidatus Diapherotrites archaeon]